MDMKSPTREITREDFHGTLLERIKDLLSFIADKTKVADPEVRDVIPSMFSHATQLLEQYEALEKQMWNLHSAVANVKHRD
jgi:hypothetical protein